MSQPLRRTWRTLRTLVGCDRRWLPTPAAAAPSGERLRHERDATATVETDGIAGGHAGTRSDSPAERIREALAENDGRLDQGTIPEEAGLSQSTVSRTLIQMEERGEVTRYEIGRGKVVFLPGEEPEVFQSPIDDADTPHRMSH